jgi:hypothetical protein
MKYELTSETILFKGKTLFRIKSLTSFGDVVEGDLGGYLESKSNLSQVDVCWVYNDAKVMGGSRISNSARVAGQAVVLNTIMNNESQALDEAQLDGCHLSGDACVDGSKIKVFQFIYKKFQNKGDLK